MNMKYSYYIKYKCNSVTKPYTKTTNTFFHIAIRYILEKGIFLISILSTLPHDIKIFGVTFYLALAAVKELFLFS